jgi:tetratricopeptide (TPR) repeat protein
MMRKNIITSRWIAGPLLCGVLGISGCVAARPSVTYIPPPAPVTIRPTSESSALVELQLARDKLADARAALDIRDYGRARLLTEQALAEAQLAELRADTESTRQAARDLRMSVDAAYAEAARAATTTVYLPPASPIELQFATEELARAKLALNMGDYERARRLAEQAQIDAQTAELRAESENSRRLARFTRLDSEALRAEAGRVVITSPLPYPVELQLAREEFDSARLALDARQYERARRLAEQALADAQLAEARAATESTRLAARDLRVSIESLRAQATRLAALY